MLPSRGLRWSSQTIGIGRRRIELTSARNFSSNRSIKASPFVPNKRTPLSRLNTPFPSSRTADFLRNGAGVRFASTTPIPVIPSPPTNAPIEVVSSSAGSPSNAFLSDNVNLDTGSLLDIPESIGYLKSLGLDYGWGPTAGMEWLLEHIHVFAGTPWWMSITLTAVLVRAVLFKPYMDAAENGTRLATIQHFLKPIQTKMRDAARLGDTALTMELRAELVRINARAGIKIWKNFVPMLQVFAGYGTFVLLRAMSNLPVPGLETGGFLWFQNLTISDPFYILPMATAAVLHLVIKRGGETGVNTMDPKMQKALMWGFPALTLIFTSWLPSALQLSFFVSGLLSAGQSTLFRQSWFRRRFNMTPLPTIKPAESSGPPSPYQGKIKRIEPRPLSTSELGSRFEGPKAASKPTSILGAPITGIKSTFSSITEAGKGVVEMSKERMAKNDQRASARQRKAYEEKRRGELRQEAQKRLMEQRAERAARKAMRNGEE